MSTESVPFYKSPLFWLTFVAGVSIAAIGISQSGDPLLSKMDAINAGNAATADKHYKWLDDFGYEK